jgi:hypothetical protein
MYQTRKPLAAMVMASNKLSVVFPVPPGATVAVTATRT